MIGTLVIGWHGLPSASHEINGSAGRGLNDYDMRGVSAAMARRGLGQLQAKMTNAGQWPMGTHHGIDGLAKRSGKSAGQVIDQAAMNYDRMTPITHAIVEPTLMVATSALEAAGVITYQPWWRRG